MQLFAFVGAVLLALLTVLLPALAHRSHRNFIRESWRRPLGLALGVLQSELGAIIVTYCTPILGAPTITAITAAQASQVPEQQAQIQWADADTTAVFVHNWGLPNSFPTWLWPQLFMYEVGGTASQASFATAFNVSISNTNSVAITKVGVGTGSGGTFNVYLRRPHSVGQ